MAHFTPTYQSPTAGPGAGHCFLPAGQYAYQLVVAGQLVAAPQKLFVNP